ncbi:hypothetical protein KJ766_03010 [Patescibacteria group bacterium]|nr:hypothetical protein [Patescibacteria group bacterium]
METFKIEIPVGQLVPLLYDACLEGGVAEEMVPHLVARIVNDLLERQMPGGGVEVLVDPWTVQRLLDSAA